MRWQDQGSAASQPLNPIRRSRPSLRMKVGARRKKEIKTDTPHPLAVSYLLRKPCESCQVWRRLIFYVGRGGQVKLHAHPLVLSVSNG